MSLADLKTLVAEPWADCGLIDSGNGRKLERYGPVTRRPARAAGDVGAGAATIGTPTRLRSRLRRGRRRPLGPASRRCRASWPLARGKVRFHASLTPFRHLGFFPDMAPQWDWMRERLATDAEVLNLFGYTGVGTLRCARPARGWSMSTRRRSRSRAGKANAALSGMAERPIRWIVDDAAKFTAREVRRGRRYDGILLDPPKFGRGPDGRGLAAGGASRAADRRLPQAARRRQPLPGAHRLCGADVGAGDRRAAAAGDWPISAARSNAARWRCARKRAGCCCRPRSSRAGRRD